MESKTFYGNRRAGLVTYVSKFTVSEKGIEGNLEIKILGVVTLRKFHIVSLQWNEVHSVDLTMYRGMEAAKTTPVDVARFINPVSQHGAVRMRVAVDSKGAWLLPIKDARQFAAACQPYLKQSS